MVCASSEEGGVVVNGMSEYARDGENADSALLVGIEPELFPNSDVLSGENVNLITTADFFTPYSKDFGNIDVNWDVLISMKINKVLSATINTTLKYDNDVKTFDDNGVKKGAKVQFKEVHGIGLAYNF